MHFHCCFIDRLKFVTHPSLSVRTCALHCLMCIILSLLILGPDLKKEEMEQLVIQLIVDRVLVCHFKSFAFSHQMKNGLFEENLEDMQVAGCNLRNFLFIQSFPALRNFLFLF